MAGGDSLLAPGKGDPEAVAGRAGLGDLADQVATALKGRGIRRVTLFVDETYAGWAHDGADVGPDVPQLRHHRRGRDARPVEPAGTGRRRVRPTPSSRCGRPSSAARARGIDVRSPRGRAPGARFADADTDPLRCTVCDARDSATQDVGTAAPTEGPGAILGSVQSAPVREQLALALTDSDNALTEILARQAAYRSGAGTAFAAVGSWVVSQVAALGLDTAGVTLSDASGLSRENRVRASLLSDVLVLGYDGNTRCCGALSTASPSVA